MKRIFFVFLATGIVLCGCAEKRVLVDFHAIPSTLVLEDEFIKMDWSKWYWRIDGEADRSLTFTGIELRVKASADDKSISNSEFYNHAYPYKKVFAQIHLKNDNVENGSRGWGFWNGRMDAAGIDLAWFVRLQRPEGYDLNGFFAVTRRKGRETKLTRIENISLEDWHTYSIDWRDDSVKFWIDDILVADHKTSIPQGSMRFDVWINNATYKKRKNVYKPVYQNIIKPTSLQVDSLRIYKLSLFNTQIINDCKQLQSIENKVNSKIWPFANRFGPKSPFCEKVNSKTAFL